jgi:hypothetical protein
MRVLSSVVPPGGWTFRQKLTSSPQRPRHQLLSGATYDQLLDNVFKFRLNNLEMVPVGTATKESVEQDVGFFICGQWPNNCTGSRAQFAKLETSGQWPGKQFKVDYRRPLTRIEDWITRLTTETLRFVDNATALERAQICLKCPLHQAWRTGCGPCNDNATRRATLIRGSHLSGLESKLKACIAFGTLQELSVWLEEDFSSTRIKRLPDKCWKVKAS